MDHGGSKKKSFRLAPDRKSRSTRCSGMGFCGLVRRRRTGGKPALPRFRAEVVGPEIGFAELRGWISRDTMSRVCISRRLRRARVRGQSAWCLPAIFGVRKDAERRPGSSLPAVSAGRPAGHRPDSRPVCRPPADVFSSVCSIRPYSVFIFSLGRGREASGKREIKLAASTLPRPYGRIEHTSAARCRLEARGWPSAAESFLLYRAYSARCWQSVREWGCWGNWGPGSSRTGGCVGSPIMHVLTPIGRCQGPVVVCVFESP